MMCLMGFLGCILVPGLNAQFAYDWPSHSALSEGQWFKLATVRSGFHKVDANLISSLGLDPATVNPDRINLYGHGVS